MSTYSTNLGLTLIGTGEQAGTWGTTTNTNLGTLLEQAISGYASYSCSGGTDTITIPDGADGTARNMYIQLNGTGGGTVQVPAKAKLYFIFNNTASAITVKVSGQTGVSVPAGKKMSLVNNGTDVVVATNHMAALSLDAALPVTSGGTGSTTSTGSGAVVLATSPTLTTPTLNTPTLNTPSLSNPSMTGTPTAPTATAGTNTTQVATTAFVTTAVTNATGSLGTMSTQNANNVNITGGAISSVTLASARTTNVLLMADQGFMFNSDGGQDTGIKWLSDGVFAVQCNGVVVGTFNSTGWTGSVNTQTGAGTVGAGGSFTARTGPTGKCLIQLQGNIYATYGSFGDGTVYMTVNGSTVASQVGRTMEYDGRTSGAYPLVTYLYSGSANTNITVTYTYSGPGGYRDGSYSFIGT